MIHQKSLKIAKTPFFLADAILLGVAYFIFINRKPPMSDWEMFAYVLCAALGALCSILPFVLEYRAKIRLAESEGLATVVSQIQSLEEIGSQISAATAQWQNVHEAAGKTGRVAAEIAERMATEVKAFNEFMQKANDTEKSALRLEVEKLRRTEAEWLQVLVRMLDHVYALHSAALRSRKPSLIEQLSHFQNACRDAARRVGLMPFVAESAERFDGQRYQVADGEGQPAPDATIEETLASGYTFQGRMLRPALVRLRNGNGKVEAVTEGSAGTADQPNDSHQSQLAFESVTPQPTVSPEATENGAGIS